MSNTHRLRCRFVTIIITFGTLFASATVRADDQNRPRLVVIVVVDQLRADYLTRFDRYFGNDGFRRLMRDGAHFANAHFSSLASATAPGHATISTGATPRVHGIIANKWFMDRESLTGDYAVYDPGCDSLPPSDRGDAGRSPRQLRAPTLGDELKLADRRARVVSIALKDRGAIFLGGRLADRALWWDSYRNGFASSTYYGDALPDYVTAFNAADPIKKYAGFVWSPIVPETAISGCFPLQPDWHALYESFGSAFPHTIPPFDGEKARAAQIALGASPAGNEIVLDLVEEALKHERLGDDDAIDLLCVGLSSNDLVGHFFGPQSAEVMDMTAQTDRQIARLMKMLDERVGRDGYVVALTADHGVKATPQIVQSLRLPGGVYDPRLLGNELNDHLQQAFFPESSETESPARRVIVVGVEVPWIYLNTRLIQTLKPDRRAALFDSAIAFLRTKEFVDDAYGLDALNGLAPPATDEGRLLAWNAYHADNAGQICLRIAPNWKKLDDNLAGHSGGTRPERHVPILISGPRIRPGRYVAPARPCDIAVTLAAILGIEPPAAAEGRVLDEAFSTEPLRP